jgi:hypothetical protein
LLRRATDRELRAFDVVLTDSARGWYRCDGSSDVTRGGAPHEPFGFWLKSQPVLNETIAKEYNAQDLFELQTKRYAELGHARSGNEKGPFGSYAIPDPMPLVLYKKFVA